MKKRKRLVELALEQKLSVKRICQRLSIKLSTAKQIIKKFRDTGTFFTKKSHSDNQNTTTAP